MRDVAVQHAINPMTVSRAYGQLEAEGLLTRLRGKGMIVALDGHVVVPAAQRLARLDALLTDVARQARELNLSAELVLQRLKLHLKDSE